MKIPKIGQGTGHKGDDALTFNEDLHSIVDNIRFGIEMGLTFIDTAEIYCEGRSEIAVGVATKHIRNEVIIASKFSPSNHQRKNLLVSIKNSLDRLQTDYLDLYQIHWPNERVPLEETLMTMFDLQDEGIIREVGLCNFNKSQLSRAIALASERNSRIFSNQIKFSLIDQYAYRQIHSVCKEREIKIIAYSPIRSLLRQDNKRSDLLERYSLQTGFSPAQIALKWVVHHEGVSTIPESSKIERISEFASVEKLQLDKEILESLSVLFENITKNVSVSLIRSQNVARAGAVRDLSQREIAKFANDFTPSIIDLASEIEAGNFLQPLLIRVHPEESNLYQIVEGELRYWAFVYCFGANSKVPVIVL